MKQNIYEAVKAGYGKVSSFAIWASPRGGEGAKSGIADLSPLDPVKNPGVLERLRNDVVFVGLNPSRGLKNKPDFANFHDESPRGTDYILRRTLAGTPWEGAFMTDFIHDFIHTDAKAAMKKIKADRKYYKNCMDAFIRELNTLAGENGKKPVLVAMGNDVEMLLRDSYCKRFENESDLTAAGFTVGKISHYAASVSSRKRQEELDALRQIFSGC